jgi:hypothetical protein
MQTPTVKTRRVEFNVEPLDAILKTRNFQELDSIESTDHRLQLFPVRLHQESLQHGAPCRENKLKNTELESGESSRNGHQAAFF